MSSLTEHEFNKAIFSSYKKKYEEVIASWYEKDALENILLNIPEDLDKNSSPGEVLQAVKEISAHEAFVYSVNDVIKYARVSLDTLREYAEYIDWDIVVTKQVLDEEFIEEFINELDMQKVLLFQDLSESFVNKHVKKAKIKLKSEKVNNALTPKQMGELLNTLREQVADPRHSHIGGMFGDNNMFSTYSSSSSTPVSNLTSEEPPAHISEESKEEFKEQLKTYFNYSDVKKHSGFRKRIFDAINKKGK